MLSVKVILWAMLKLGVDGWLIRMVSLVRIDNSLSAEFSANAVYIRVLHLVLFSS